MADQRAHTVWVALQTPCHLVAQAVVVVLLCIAGPRGAAAPAVWATSIVVAALAFIDLATHRLPNRIVGPAWLLVCGWLVGVAGLTGSWHHALGAVAGSLGLAAGYLFLALVRAGAMGGGDVKLAGLLGLSGGWFGLHSWTWVLIAPFVIGGVIAAIGLLFRRFAWSSHIPFGPAMALGYLMAAVVVF